MISSKFIFGQVCKEKYTWDEALPDEICKQWNAYPQALLACINATFDPLGWAGCSKSLQNCCLVKYAEKHTWDQALPEEIAKQWHTYTQALKEHPTVAVPRTVCTQPGSALGVKWDTEAGTSGVNCNTSQPKILTKRKF